MNHSHFECVDFLFLAIRKCDNLFRILPNRYWTIHVHHKNWKSCSITIRCRAWMFGSQVTINHSIDSNWPLIINKSNLYHIQVFNNCWQVFGMKVSVLKCKWTEYVHPFPPLFNTQTLSHTHLQLGLPGFRRKSMVGQLTQVAKLGCMFPVYSTIYMIAPNSDMGKFMKKPFVKFICHSTSYATFLREYKTWQWMKLMVVLVRCVRCTL